MSTRVCARGVRGFSLIELMVVVSLIAIVAGIAIPAITSSSEQLRLANAARRVERVLQTAKLKAVRADRVMRVRFNCPAARQYRMVEVLGTQSAPAGDDADSAAATRCSETNYPYPDTNTDFFAVPNHDGPVGLLPDGVGFSAVQTVDFWPDGTVHAGGAGTPLPGTGITLAVYDIKRGTTVNKSITVNGLGKVTLQ
jgi:prepilin-type N-terminal cleavage/methylation domain-containing protein